MAIALLVEAARAADLAAPSLDELRWPEGGKPQWPGGADFSLSHGGGFAGCALLAAPGRVGLDLEAAGAASAVELRLVRHPADPVFSGSPAEATALWVAKEAVLKAAGVGIAEASSVRVRPDSADFGGSRWRLWRPAIAAGLSCAVASDVDASLSVVGHDAMTLLTRGP